MTDIKTIYEQLLKEESNPKKRTVKSSNENIMTISQQLLLKYQTIRTVNQWQIRRFDFLFPCEVVAK